VKIGGCEYLPDGTRIQHTRCWPCQTGQCPGGLHTWADADDVAHALATGQPDPSQSKCGCACADGPVLAAEPLDDIDDASFDDMACPVCGSDAACGYDSEGRALIHALSGDDGEAA
jgi:hypothetical protein